MTDGEDKRLIAVFDSIHYVLAAERVLKQRGLRYELVPTPRAVSSDCGMVVEFREADMPGLREAWSDPRVALRALYRKTAGGFEIVEQVDE